MSAIWLLWLLGATPARAEDPVAGDPAAEAPAWTDSPVEIPADDLARLSGVRGDLRAEAPWCVTEAALAPWDKGWCEAIPPGCDGMAASCRAEPPRGCQEAPSVDVPQTGLPVAELLQAAAIALAAGLVGWAIRLWWRGREPEPEPEAAIAEAPPEVREIPDALPEGEDPLAAAEAAARSGDAAAIGRALLILRRTSLDTLARASRLVLHPSRTDREYVRALSSAPGLAADLRVIVQAVERHRYAGRAVTSAMFAEALSAAQRLRAGALGSGALGALLISLIGAAQAGPTDHGLALRLLTGMGYTRMDPASYFARPGLILFDAAAVTEESGREFLQMVEDGATGVMIADQQAGWMPPGLALEERCEAGIQSRIGPTQPIRLVEPCRIVRYAPEDTPEGGASDTQIVAADAAGAPVGLDLPLGSGRLVVIGAPGLLDDASALHPGNAEFLLRIARRTDAWSVGVFKGELIQPSPLALLAQAGLLPAAGQGALLFLVACWWRGRRFATPADPPEPRRRDTTEHLRAVAGFYRSHGASRAVLAARARWSLAWMRRRLRVEDPQLAAALSARTGAPRERVERILLRTRQAMADFAAHPDAPGESADLYLEEELWELMDSLRRAGSTPAPPPPAPTSNGSPSGSAGWSRR